MVKTGINNSAFSLMLFCVLGVIFSCKNGGAQSEWANLEKGTVEISGVVLRNVKMCEVDGPCYLDVETKLGKVRVSYGSGRGSQCSNKDAMEVGFNLNVGQRVLVRGYSNGGSGILMCRKGEGGYNIEKLD